MAGLVLGQNGPLLGPSGLPYACDECPCDDCVPEVVLTFSGVDAAVCSGCDGATRDYNSISVDGSYVMPLVSFFNGVCQYRIDFPFEFGAQPGFPSVNVTQYPSDGVGCTGPPQATGDLSGGRLTLAMLPSRELTGIRFDIHSTPGIGAPILVLLAFRISRSPIQPNDPPPIAAPSGSVFTNEITDCDTFDDPAGAYVISSGGSVLLEY